jgi:DeoR family fructose operon transcriptional repressor
MLTQERQAAILQLLLEKGSISVTDLTALLNSSDSTIRRDLNALDAQGLLHKVRGGATALENRFSREENEVAVRYKLYREEKAIIAKEAAALVKPGDLVYIDAGTTTERMTDFLTCTDAVYMTNGIQIARKLARHGLTVYVPAGRIKNVTEAIVGGETHISLLRYNFTLGFFGTNGITLHEGFTTPDPAEARVKSTALSHCQRRIVLADPSKFGALSAVSFAKLSEAEIMTTKQPDPQYRNTTTILLAGEKAEFST